jgi:hypothetical protein
MLSVITTALDTIIREAITTYILPLANVLLVLDIISLKNFIEGNFSNIYNALNKKDYNTLINNLQREWQEYVNVGHRSRQNSANRDGERWHPGAEPPEMGINLLNLREYWRATSMQQFNEWINSPDNKEAKTLLLNIKDGANKTLAERLKRCLPDRGTGDCITLFGGFLRIIVKNFTDINLIPIEINYENRIELENITTLNIPKK